MIFFRNRSVCSIPGACAAIPERVQQPWSVCSSPRACSAIPERVQQFGACAASSERVQQVGSVCSKLGACAVSWERVQQSQSCSEHRAEKSIKSGYRTLGVVGGVGRGDRADLTCKASQVKYETITSTGEFWRFQKHTQNTKLYTPNKRQPLPKNN